MKFFIGDGVELELSPEIEKNIIVVNDLKFKHNNIEYNANPIEFTLHDAYILLYQLMKKNPNKKIFIHHFEQLAHEHYAMYYAVEK